MTLEEWVNSEYNIYEFQLDDEYVTLFFSEYIVDLGYIRVRKTDITDANDSYVWIYTFRSD